MDFIKSFYIKYPYFNILEYKKFNPKLKNLTNIGLLHYYDINIINEKLICSIKDFYILYPYFDIIFYKIYYDWTNQIKSDNINYLIHYHNIGVVENRIYSLNNFKERYNVDFIFLQSFYNKFTNKSEIEILTEMYNRAREMKSHVAGLDSFIAFALPESNNAKNTQVGILRLVSPDSNQVTCDLRPPHLFEEVNPTRILNKYIYSDEIFTKKFPEFNITIYKLSNPTLYFDNDVKYKGDWYMKKIINLDKTQIASIDDILKNNPNFNLELYKNIYNHSINESNDENIIINWYKNKDNLVYSLDTFNKYIDDFNFTLIVKHIPILKKYNHIEIIKFYIKNINKINNIYSEKLFYLKYPLFKLNEYKKFNKLSTICGRQSSTSSGLDSGDASRMSPSNHNSVLSILNEYNLSKNKNNIIISNDDFNNKFINFNLDKYKIYLEKNKNNIILPDSEYKYYWYINDSSKQYNNYPVDIDKINPMKDFDFDINIYNYFNSAQETKSPESSQKTPIIYSKKLFYELYNNFDKDIYYLFNFAQETMSNSERASVMKEYTEEDIIIHFHSIGLSNNLIYNANMINEDNYGFNLKIYKELNKDLEKLTDIELIIHWFKFGRYQNRIYSTNTFFDIYDLTLETDIEGVQQGKSEILQLASPESNQITINLNQPHMTDSIIKWMNHDIYNYLQKKDKNIIGRDVVNNIYEVLIDLSNPFPKNKLEKGISLIIRAKNEELNIKDCIESVVDLVDEIIFVDNNSTDSTYNIVKKYTEIHKNIKLYRYNINVSKAGIEHKNAIDNNDMNTLGTFYNWCLSKATKYNVFKWDADFICIRNNFTQLVNIYNVRERDDKFAIWFSGKTLFENNNKYYLNYNSYYNEFRIFSYKNNFRWDNGNICEYTEPYLNECSPKNKYKYEYPLFYETKRTSIDEFSERSALIDIRDINDFNILNSLKIEAESKSDNLILIKNNIINNKIKIVIYTPSLSFGGGNQFIINMYKLYKSFGFNVIIIPINYDNTGKDKYNIILQEDIFMFTFQKTECEGDQNKNSKIFNFIKNFRPHYAIFNSDIPDNIEELYNITKIIFITHSDVAYANYFIKKYHKYMHKIITVNKYTIEKLSKISEIDESKFFKICNY